MPGGGPGGNLTCIRGGKPGGGPGGNMGGRPGGGPGGIRPAGPRYGIGGGTPTGKPIHINYNLFNPQCNSYTSILNIEYTWR